MAEETKAHFNGLKALLDAAGIAYQVNERLVRGLDYYNYTVFEWVTESLGAQGTIVVVVDMMAWLNSWAGQKLLLLVSQWGLNV